MIKFVLLLICVHQLVSIEGASILGSADTILLYKNEPYNGIDGGYSFEYETIDKQLRKENGIFVRMPDDKLVLRVTGYYRYIGTDGRIRFIEYEADENGYKQTVKILKQLIKKRINPNALKSLVG